MGFLDKLRMNIAVGTNPNEPLFGGLIPRREVESGISGVPEARGPANPIRPTGMQNVQNAMINPASATQAGRQLKFGGMVGDDSNPGADILNRAKTFGEQLFGTIGKPNVTPQSEIDAEANRKENTAYARMNEDRKFGNEADKTQILQRKQALDEWEAKNPEGAVQIAEDGKVHLIDKRTGKTIDTGLMSDHLSEEKKLQIQARNAADLERQRQTGRETLQANNFGGRISPSQQIVAKKDAANELLNDPRFSWMNKGPDATDNVIQITPEGVVIKRQAKGSGNNAQMNKQIDDANTMIDLFEQELKTKTDEMINRTIARPAARPDGKVEMIHPKTGEKLFVPAGEVEQARTSGAYLPGEAPPDNRVIKSVPQDAVDDSIELFYNDRGKVAGVRNRKNPNVSPFEK